MGLAAAAIMVAPPQDRAGSGPTPGAGQSRNLVVSVVDHFQRRLASGGTHHDRGCALDESELHL
jgi:hypothetical protein